MANPVTCEIKGLDQLQTKLEAVASGVAKQGMRQALRDGGNVVKAAMEQAAPDRTGFLRQHFGIKLSMKGHGDLAGAVFIGPDKAIYPKGLTGRVLSETLRMSKAVQKMMMKGKGRVSVVSVCRFLEFGTTKMSKRPFMTQSFKSSSSKAIDAITKALKAAVERVR